jgi:hypothetical protein
MSRWISFPEEELTVTKEAAVDVEFHVNAPESIPDGSQYAALLVQSISEDHAAGVNISLQLVSLLFAQTPGHTIKQGEVVSRNIKFWYTKPTIQTSVKIKNDGNVDFAANVSVKVSDLFGNNVYSSENKSMTLLPETSRSASIDWANVPTFGLFWLEQETSFLDKTDNTRRLILIMPLHILTIFFMVLVALAFVAYWLICKRLRRRTKLLASQKNKKLNKHLQNDHKLSKMVKRLKKGIKK